MLVCHCHRVSDARIDQVLAAAPTGSAMGAAIMGTAGMRRVVRATRAGSACGGCIPMLRRLCAERADGPSRASCDEHARSG